MKYLLFAGQCYYPKGGYNDLVEASDDRMYLQRIALKMKEMYACDWWQVVDIHFGVIACSDTLPYDAFCYPKGAEVVES